MPIALFCEHDPNHVRSQAQVDVSGHVVSRIMCGRLFPAFWLEQVVDDANVDQHRTPQFGIIGILQYTPNVVWQDDLTLWNREAYVLCQAVGRPTHAFSVDVLSVTVLEEPLEVHASISNTWEVRPRGFHS